MATQAVASGGVPSKKPSQQEMQKIVEGLNSLRNEQRQLGSKLADIEGDLNEHRLVIEALKNAPPERRCFRSVGGVLIEQKVQNVIPDLEKNYELIQKTVETYQGKIQEKGSQLTDYVKTHNLSAMLRGGAPDAEDGAEDKSAAAAAAKAAGTSVLV